MKRAREHNASCIPEADYHIQLEPTYQEAQFIVQVAVRQVFPNCPGYIHKMQRLERSKFVPRPAVTTPVSCWKRMEWACDVLPAGDPARMPEEK